MSSIYDFPSHGFTSSSSSLSALLPSYIESGITFRSATRPSIGATDLHFNFLSFLALAQAYHVDFLPISWQPALDTGLFGRTAKISEALVNLQLNLAFKRVQRGALDEVPTFKALLSEILVLGQPAIVKHPNIIKLEGICWEISPTDHEVWPVMVFEKAQSGDLRRFLLSDEGRRLPLENRIRLCVDIGRAIASMHESNVIHGDIKPENVLVFGRKTDEFSAKISDFGFSTVAPGSSDINEILLPRSRAWHAPEWHPRPFTFEDAMKAEIYSFGLISLWIIFEEKFLRESTALRAGSEVIEGQPESSSLSDVDRQNYCVQELRRMDDLQGYLAALIEDFDFLNNPQKSDLREFFSSALKSTSSVRTANLRSLMPLLGDEKSFTMPVPALEGVEVSFPHRDFEVTQNLFSLSKAGYRVRRHLIKCLEEQANSDSCNRCRQNAAFQLAICCYIGFGTECNEKQATFWLERSGKQSEDLSARVEQIRTIIPDWPYSNERMTTLHNHGFLKTTDYADEYRNAGAALLVKSTYSQEIETVKETLGAEHPVVMVLRDILISFFRAEGNLEQSAAMRRKLQEDLENSQKFGPQHLDTLASVSDLAEILRLQGNYSLADMMNRRALKGREELLGEIHPNTMISVSNLAMVLQAQERNAEAELMNRRVLQQREVTLGPDHPATLNSMNNLALLLQSRGNYEDAIEMHERVIGGCKRGFGPGHVSTFMSFSNLGSVLGEVGNFGMAQEKHRDALKGFEKLLGPEHPYTIASMSNLASVLQLSEDYPESEELHRKTLDKQVVTLRREHPETLASTNNLGLVLAAQGSLDAAQELHEAAVDGRTKTVGENHGMTLRSVSNLASTLQEKGEYAAAEQLHRRAE